MRSATIVGMGRAGSAFATALATAGWEVTTLHHGELGSTGELSTDLVLLCVPDGKIADVAVGLELGDHTVVAHCAGSLGLSVLAPSERRASIHPLMSLPPAPHGAKRLESAWFAVAGDPIAAEVVAAIGGRSFEVPDVNRALYHAGSAIASNHLVALLGQVERAADEIGVPFEAYLELARASVDNVSELGPREALTGPVARGDWETVSRHRESLPDREVPGYEAGVELAKMLLESGNEE